jgi:serine/threonine-protein kinase ULK4
MRLTFGRWYVALFRGREHLTGISKCVLLCAAIKQKGCVLYEMFFGRPPFKSTSLNTLVTQILHHEPKYERKRPAPHTSTISENFKVLLSQMLEVRVFMGLPVPPSALKIMAFISLPPMQKNPYDRIAWKELLAHRYWDSLQAPQSEDLPVETLFEMGRPPHSMTTDGPDVDAMRRSGVDVMRLSRIVKRNQSEAYGQDRSHYEKGRDSPDTNQQRLAEEPSSDVVEDESDVMLKGTDTELDFDVETEYVGHGEDTRENESSDGDRSPIPEDDDLQQIDIDSDDDEGNVSRQHSDVSSIANEIDSDTEDEGFSVGPEKAAQEPPPYESDGGRPANRGGSHPPSAWDRRKSNTTEPASPNYALAEQQSPSTGGLKTVPSRRRDDSSSSQESSESNAEIPTPLHWNDIFCPQDFAVKPIVLNSGIEQIKQPTFDEERLAFPPLDPNRVLTLSSESLNEFLSKVFNSLKNSNRSEEKLNTLGYLYTLCFSSKFSNVLVNSPLVDLMLSMAKKSKVNALKSRLLLVVGVLVRHSTLIRNSQVMSENGMLVMLTSFLREGSNSASRPVVSR